jgi:hypothetical protein
MVKIEDILIKAVQIQTVDSCNASCISCPYRLIYHSHKTMDTVLFKKIIHELKKHCREKCLIDFFLENEPFLDSELFDKIAYAKQIMPKITVGIITNGILLSQNIENIIKYVDNIFVSMDGCDSETYNIIHKTNITESDWEEMNKCYNILENSHIKTNRNRYYKLENETSQEFVKRYLKSKKYTRGGILNHITPIKYKKLHGCKKNIPWNWINILVDGTVILCCMDYTRSTVLGNIKHQTLEEIFNSHLYQNVMLKVEGKIDSKDDFICKNCELAIGE